MYEISKYVDTNILGTANILDCIINSRNCVQKIILSSSRAVYGEGKYKCKIHGFVYPGTRKESDMKRAFLKTDAQSVVHQLHCVQLQRIQCSILLQYMVLLNKSKRN